MKSKFLPFLFLLLPIVCSGQYSWQALPNAPKSPRFDDFYFINPDTGWAINPYYSFLTTPLAGRVFKTTDGGTTWKKLIDNSITYYRSIGFVDGLTGWIGNLADTTLYTNGTTSSRATTDTVPLYQTNDGGVTWSPAILPQPHPLGICGISVVTDSIVFAYGRYFGPAGYIKTLDKGANWVFTDLNSFALGLIDGHFFNKDTGFITGMGTDHKAIILSTNDGGATWQFSYHSTRIDSDRVWKIYFPSRNTGYASIEYGGSQRTYNTFFLKTTDGGNTWSEHSFMASYNEEGIGFANDSVGWIGGDGTRGTYITRDGGNSWNTDEAFGVVTPPYTNGTAGFEMNRFRSFGDTLMYASGNTIYKLRNGTTGIKEVPKEDENLDNYPNPFDYQTTIIYSLKYSSDNVFLQVNNVLGQNVFAKNLGYGNAGNHQLIFDEQLPAGIYYYSISSGQSRVTKKMVVSR